MQANACLRAAGNGSWWRHCLLNRSLFARVALQT
jgi:hypothetical protein